MKERIKIKRSMYLNRTEKWQGAQNIQKQRYKYINKQKRKKRAKKKKD